MLIECFTLKERILSRLGFNGFIAVGAYGIYKQSTLWAAIYVVVSILIFAAVIMPSICARCPYPSKYNTCLFLPPAFMNRFYPYKEKPMSRFQKIAALISFAILAIMPQPWLLNDLVMLALFWLICLPTLAVFPLYYCKHCRNFLCPLNKYQEPESRV